MSVFRELRDATGGVVGPPDSSSDFKGHLVKILMRTKVSAGQCGGGHS